jgi:hypothetical protein
MKSIKPNDLGNNQMVEWSQKININLLVREFKNEIKQRLIQSKLEILGINIDLATSKTRFGGGRLWFVCPICKTRIGTIFQSNHLIGCRKCLNIRYKAQRFNKMTEIEKL